MDLSKSGTDFTSSVERALSEIDPQWEKYPGLFIPGTHEFHGTDEKLRKLHDARMKGLPTFGECAGFQLMMIEFARNALHLEKANTTEIDPRTPHPIFIRMSELRVGIYRVKNRMESFWYNYQFNPAYKRDFEDYFILTEADDILIEARYKTHPFYMGTAYHPSYNSSLANPHPLLTEFISECRIADGANHSEN